MLAEAHRDLADVDKEAEAEDRENETRIKLAVMAKMMKATISTAFQTWRENTFAYGVRRKLTVEEALAEKERMLKEFKDLVNDMLGYDGEWYNDDNHYKDAMTWSLDTKAGIIVKYREIRGERFRRLDPDAKQRILDCSVIEEGCSGYGSLHAWPSTCVRVACFLPARCNAQMSRRDRGL